MKRIKAIVDSIEVSPQSFYDLFCDHGKLGHEVHKKFPHSFIIFNDIREHLIKKIEERNYENSPFQTQMCDARNIVFKEHSLIAMCGVGGNLAIDCLKYYQKLSNFPSLTFILSVNMHHFELRKYLIDNNYSLIKYSSVGEAKRCYEILHIKPGKDPSNLEIFTPDQWDKNNSIHLKHLQSKINAIKNKVAKEKWEIELEKSLIHFLQNN